MISREEAYALVRSRLTNKNLVKHVLAVESIMRALAARFGGDVEVWGLAGLLHDVDYEETKDAPERHGYRTLEILEETDLPDEVRGAILAHAGHTERLSAQGRPDL